MKQHKHNISVIYWAFILLTLALFVAHQFLQHYLMININLLDNYLDPFCLGVLLTLLFQWEHRWRFPNRELSFLELTLMIIIVSIISEMLFPYLSNEFVADPWDAVAIAVGSLITYGLRKRVGQSVI